MMLAGAWFKKVSSHTVQVAHGHRSFLAAIWLHGSWEIHGKTIHQELLTTQILFLVLEKSQPPAACEIIGKPPLWPCCNLLLLATC